MKCIKLGIELDNSTANIKIANDKRNFFVHNSMPFNWALPTIITRRDIQQLNDLFKGRSLFLIVLEDF